MSRLVETEITTILETCEDRKPNIPQNPQGTLTPPLVSTPKEKSIGPLAIATTDSLEHPPGIRSGVAGFVGVPKSSEQIHNYHGMVGFNVNI